MENITKQKEFDGTISLQPYKFHAERKANDVIYVSIFQENNESFNTKDEPMVRLSIDMKKKPRWEILRNVGGVYIAAMELDRIADEAIKQLSN